MPLQVARLCSSVFGQRTVNRTLTQQQLQLCGHPRVRLTVLAVEVDVGLKLIRAGLAWHFKRFQHEQDPETRLLYAKAVEQAKALRKGLWGFYEPMAPWVRAVDDAAYCHGLRGVPSDRSCATRLMAASEVVSAVVSGASREKASAYT